jgi:ribosomal protein L21E
MVVRSKGALSKRTKKLAVKRKLTISDITRSFKVGQKVMLSPKSLRAGMPNPKYANRMGQIVEKRGDSYVVRIMDGNKAKDMIAHPVHLRLA